MATPFDKLEIHVVTQKRFTLGPTVCTPGALVELSPEDILVAVTRHANGDWGELPDEDRNWNSVSLERGEGRLISRYQSASGRWFWVITEADRSVTTVLLPEEY